MTSNSELIEKCLFLPGHVCRLRLLAFYISVEYHRSAGCFGSVRVYSRGLPVGLHLVGRRYADATVLRAAAAFEEARPWNEKRPSLWAVGRRGRRIRCPGRLFSHWLHRPWELL